MNATVVSTALVMDAANERVAFSGKLYIDGRPTSTKNCTAAGGCSIQWRAGTISGFAGADDSITIGIQDVSTTTAPTQPDGTFGVSGTFVGDTDPPTTDAWNTSDMETNGDDTSYSHGDLISIVFDETACNGCSITVSGITGQSQGGIPLTGLRTAGSWAGQTIYPNAIITFDDGTLGWIDGGRPFTSVTTQAFNSGSSPDEYALVFKLPFDFEIDAVLAKILLSSDTDMVLYSNPTTNPVALSTTTLDNEWERTAAGEGVVQWLLATPVKGKRGTEYGLSVKPGGVNDNIYIYNVNSAAHMAAWSGTNVMLGSTTNGAAFSTTSTSIPAFSVRICRVYSSGR